MKPTIFITRDLSDESPFSELSDEYDVSGTSLIRIKSLELEPFPTTNWIFFYSRHGVQYFFSQLDDILPKHTKYASIGPKTAAAIRAYGHQVSFTGDGHSVSTAAGFALVAKGQSVLFPRARQSMQSIQKQLTDEIIMHDLVVYDNQGKDHVKKSNADYIVFTSPLNAKTYLEKHSLDSQQKAVVMGDSTGACLRSLHVTNYLMPEKPSEESLTQLLRKEGRT
ncbi:MAG: uroporphyrinogen-III synthase [Saprospiraceae bacterium]|nr:uroporphyrinogen-III synthase [Saprospiraceae bacterium]